LKSKKSKRIHPCKEFWILTLKYKSPATHPFLVETPNLFAACYSHIVLFYSIFAICFGRMDGINHTYTNMSPITLYKY